MDHKCVCCNTRIIPVYRALCGRCFGKVPWEMRSDFIHAYRARVTNQVAYVNALLGLMNWRADAYPDWHEKGIW